MARKMPVEHLTIDEIRRPLDEPLRLAARAYKLGVFDEAFEVFAAWFVDARITREEAIKRLRALIGRMGRSDMREFKGE